MSAYVSADIAKAARARRRARNALTVPDPNTLGSLRALHREQVEEFKKVEATRKARRGETGWAAVRANIEAFERGEDTLFGFPRAKCDFPKVYADIDKAAKR